MKICHLTSVHKPEDIRIFHKECSSLARAGYEVNIIAVNCGNYFINNIPVYSVDIKYSGRLKRMITVPKAILKKSLELNCDIYHFHDPELIPVGLKLKRKGKKVIYDVHEDLPRQTLSKQYLKSWLRPTVAKFIEWYENNKSKKFDYIITSTPFIRDRFLKINKNTVDVRNYPVLDKSFIYNNWSDKKNAVCYIGGLEEARGIKEMMEAFRFVNCGFFIGGLFDNENIKEEIYNMPAWEKVNYYGYVNRNEANNIYSDSKIGLVTLHPIINYIDALPVKMFEYMHAGIPVIASNIPLWKEIVEGNNCGVCVNPLQPKEIAEAINYLLTNDEIAEEMGRNGRNAVLNKYNWNIEEKKLLNMYKYIQTD